jgi:hypothetical protein
VGLEPTIPVFERSKTVYALYGAAGHCDRPTLNTLHLNPSKYSVFNFKFKEFVITLYPI